jgi:hypothetical protein
MPITKPRALIGDGRPRFAHGMRGPARSTGDNNKNAAFPKEDGVLFDRDT